MDQYRDQAYLLNNQYTEAEPLAAYTFSGSIGSLLSSEMRETLTDLIRQELAGQKVIHITNASGLFEAHAALTTLR